jgi:LuxR family transcriptional regulator, maltose regulon positive regulatory protein
VVPLPPPAGRPAAPRAAPQAPGEIPGLHRLAAGWYAEHGHPVEAIRHAQAGGDRELGTELLGRHWVHLILDGEEATLATLLARLPAELADTDAEIATITAADLLTEARWAEADARLMAARRTIGDVPAHRRDRAETALATVRLFRARRSATSTRSSRERVRCSTGTPAPSAAPSCRRWR